MSEQPPDLSHLARQARWTAIRLRFDSALARFALLLPLPLVYAVGALTFIKVARPPHEVQTWLIGVGAVPVAVVLVGTLLAWFRRRPDLVGAIALDRHHGLHDRITSALTFRELGERTPLMDAAIDDAVAVARDLRPSKAAPVRLPRELAAAVLLAVVAAGIAMLEVRTYTELPPTKTFEPMVMSPDDIDLFRKIADELEEQNQDPDTLAAIRRFNRLVEDVAQRRLDRREVFKQMSELERDLMQGAEADKEARDEGLDRIAKELEKSSLSKPIAKHLEQKKLADAEKAMRELAEKLKKKQKKVSKEDLERLRKALREASKSTSKWQKGIEKRRQELEEQRKRLLNKKKKDKRLSKKDRKELEKKDRQLERLNREKKRADSAKRQMSKLDQELAKAAQDLMRDMGASADDINRGAEDINRMAQKEMNQSQKKELLQRLKEMREVLRQQGKGGRQRLQRMLRFGNRARGNQGQGKGGKQGKQGQGKQGQGKEGQGQGKGQGMMPGPGGQGEKIVIMPGQGLAPGQGKGQGQGPGQGQPGAGEGDKPGQGGGKGGKSWGTGHDENVKGDASELKGNTKDVTAAGVDSGEGSASAEVIHGAAQRGFVGKGYRKVFVDYRTVAEDVLKNDEIPPGYRFYVRRYFQLIRPRE